MSNDKPTQRRVFFSFDYDDVRSVEQIRNCQSLRHEKIFIDKADREKLKRREDGAIARWINEQLQGTSVTIVAFGVRTYQSKWVGYEIEQSVNKGNGLLGIDICNIKDPLRENLAGSIDPFERKMADLGEILGNRIDNQKKAPLRENLAGSIDPFEREMADLRENLAGSIDPFEREMADLGEILGNNLDAMARIANKNPLDCFTCGGDRLSGIFSSYDWVKDKGYENITDWIEEAANIARR